MTRRPVLVLLALLAAIALFTAGSVVRAKGRASKSLESQGYRNVTMKMTDVFVYSFQATKGDYACTGIIKEAPWSSSTRTSCRDDHLGRSFTEGHDSD